MEQGIWKKKKHFFGIKDKITLLVSGILVTALLISYGIFIQDKIDSSRRQIDLCLKNAAVAVANHLVIEKALALQENDRHIQQYAIALSQTDENVDIVVIADQTGRKYAHPDESQIGQIFIGEDKKDVLSKGTAYFTTKEGSMGVTRRYFYPIHYQGKQVGFVMTGKYTEVISELYETIWEKYLLLLTIMLIITIYLVHRFADYMKRVMFQMEPEEIAALFLQKETLINHAQNGVILLDANQVVRDMNLRAQKLLDGRTPNQLITKISFKDEKPEEIKMKEVVVEQKHFVVSSIPLVQKEQYFGCVITLMDWDDMNQMAAEIGATQQKNKDLRATIHEFKNNLHIILGLVQLKEYEEAEQFILRIQHMQKGTEEEFHSIQDPYIQAMLLSKMAVAREKQVQLELKNGSHLMREHGSITPNDLTTIVGNLIENALEACSKSVESRKRVVVWFEENKQFLRIRITDNGEPIPTDIKSKIWDLGSSTKGANRGFGLYLVKRRVDIYSGTIEIVEENGEKTFCIMLRKD